MKQLEAFKESNMQQTLSFNEKYNAILRKDSSYEGIFFTAVKTTGIFCRPTCTARKPKKENVAFFESAREAICSGYRPCKVCKPLEYAGQTPGYIKELLQALHEDPSVKFRDSDLLQRGIEPSSIRRWFLKHHGITFHSYQRLLRINSAFKKIKNGEKITATAYDTGYESLSGFGDTFKTIMGVSPSGSKHKRVIDLTRLETPLGTMIACAVAEGICLLEFTDRRMLERELTALGKTLRAVIIQGGNTHFRLLEEELQAYFEGRLKTFSVPLFTPGSEFQQMVWKELQNIPYGSSRSYKAQALALNKPEAVRAVANANGMNRIAIIIPCHRVIGEDGNLTGYGGGLWRKKWLLDMEKRVVEVST